jgi:hypothetical protein
MIAGATVLVPSGCDSELLSPLRWQPEFELEDTASYDHHWQHHDDSDSEERALKRKLAAALRRAQQQLSKA